MKILYITILENDKSNGGYAYRRSIGRILSLIAAPDTLDVITAEDDHTHWEGRVVLRLPNYSGFVTKIRHLLQGNIPQRDDADIRAIIQLIQKKRYDLVAFGCSETGKLLQCIKQECDVQTITFYNDVIASLKTQSLKSKIRVASKKHAEKLDSEYGDLHIVLNERDARLLEHYYHIKPDSMIPITLIDTYQPNETSLPTPNSPLTLLFVGSYIWAPNVEGALWFCQKIMPLLKGEPVQFIIAGYGMENLKDPSIANDPRIVIAGTVDDLSKIYNEADIVVGSILSGTGMKVKTAEALMHGKSFLGTGEALEGYAGMDDALCENEEAFASRIRDFIKKRPSRFIQNQRELYLNNYSIEAGYEKLLPILAGGGKRKL